MKRRPRAARTFLPIPRADLGRVGTSPSQELAMPGCAVHLLLATRVLARWRGGRSEAPFAIADDGCRDAFYAGSMGPDVGYYPGCDHMLAELAHYLKPVALVRAMID